MVQVSGISRPGGRTARTRAAVHGAVREMLSERGAELTIPAVAKRSGVHATTLYRRWRTIEALLLDMEVAELNDSSPVCATGNLRADLEAYVRQLLKDLRQPGKLGFLRALFAAASKETTAAEHSGTLDLASIVAPRVEQIQAVLDASRVTDITAIRIVELMIAPAYFWAQLGYPLDPDKDTDRLVETVFAVLTPRAPGAFPLH